MTSGYTPTLPTDEPGQVSRPMAAGTATAQLPLDHDQIADFVREARLECPLLPCRKSGFTPFDDCRICGGIYFIRTRACHLHVAKHNGHRCVRVPFVELC